MFKAFKTIINKDRLCCLQSAYDNIWGNLYLGNMFLSLKIITIPPSNSEPSKYNIAEAFADRFCSNLNPSSSGDIQENSDSSALYIYISNLPYQTTTSER
jgi:hypothetical protein